MPQEDAELAPEDSVPDVLVAVAVRAERSLRVVHVQSAQPVEPDRLVELVEHAVQLLALGDVVAGDEEVARVEADAEARMPVEPLVDHRQLPDRAADRSAGTGRV